MIGDFKRYICQILCDDIEKGTGFLINRKNIITASHVIDSKVNSIIARFYELEDKIIDIKCNTIKESCDYDIDILELNEVIELESYIKVSANMVSIKSDWLTYGYPGETSPQIAPINGSVINVHDSFNPCDFNIDLHVSNGTLTNYEGLSGAPLIIDERFYGVIVYQNGIGIKAIEFSRVKEYLESNKIVFEDVNNDEYICNINIPHFNIIENYQVKSRLDNIISKKEKANIILEGSTGIGKTTFVQHYTPPIGVKILGKYFIKVAEDTMPATYRMAIDIFYEWIEERVFDYLKIRSENIQSLTYSKIIKNISEIFNQLSKKLEENGEKAIFFVDGIDEFINYNLDEMQKLLSIISAASYKNIFFVITTNNHYKIPVSFIQNINLQENKIVLELYNEQQIKSYLRSEVSELITEIQIDILCKKSMGHPLYLRYIINYIEGSSIENLSVFIDELPSYSGDIKTYYDFIWIKIVENSHQLYFVSYLARIRQSIDKQIFRGILPNETKLNFENIIQQLNHLLINSEAIIFFHNSFSEYIKNKTEYMNKEIHHQISNYCIDNKNKEFSIINLLYHLSNGNDDDVERSINECNQEWVDKCTILNVTPDLMIYDIKDILRLACKKGKYVSVISILLLLERVDFRYNQMFIKFAFEIAKAEIYLKRPNKAMNYIIRKNNLTLSLEETLYCLEMFIQMNYTEQAKEVLFKLESTFINYIEQNDSISNYFICVMLQAYYMCMDIEYVHCKNKCLKFIKMLQQNIDESNKEYYEENLNYIISTSSSYNLWKNNEYISLNQLKGNSGINKNTTQMYLMLLDGVFKNEEKYHNIFEEDHESIVNDIEYLIQIAPLEDKEFQINVLIEKSKNYEFMKSLIIESNTYLQNYNLREDNNVDLCDEKLNKLFNHYRNKGYIFSLNPKDINLTCNTFDYNWEEYICKLIKCIALIYGRGLCYKANNDYSSLQDDYEYLMETISNKMFSFNQRAKWEQSYHILEDIIPFLMKYVAEYIAKLKKDNIEEFIELIEKKCSIQFGIYYEGYFDVLYSIILTLIKHNIDPIYIKKIVDIFLDDVKNKVQNRWERTPYLLNIVQIYSLIDCKEIAENVYNDMLKTSMGPSWYKEDQLSLLSKAIEPMSSCDISIDLIRKNFSLLDSASGGMTFERYIRVEKENLIDELWRKGFYDIAFQFMKVQLYPNFKEIKYNIEVENIDASINGLKSNRVANSIFIECCVLNILRQINCRHKFIAWLLSEIFIFKDERYLSEFIQIQSKILNSVYDNHKDEKDLFLERILTILICDCNEDKRYKFIKLYKIHLKKEVFELIIDKISEILNLNIEELTNKYTDTKLTYDNNSYNNDMKENDLKHIERVDKKDSLYLKGVFGKQTSLEEAKLCIEEGDKELKKENYKLSIDKYLECLLKINSGDWNVWNSSEYANISFNKIVNLLNDAEEIVKVLEPIITEDPHCRYWMVANKIYEIIQGKCNEKQIIISEIFNHIDTIVIQNNKFHEKYEHIEKWNSSREEEEVLLDFILWLSWYPDPFISQKVMDLLIWLIENNYNYIYKIVDRCFGEEANMTEVCVTICLYLSDKHDNTLWDIISDYEILGKIISSHSFILKSTFLKIYLNYSKSIPGAIVYLETIESYFKLDKTISLNEDNFSEKQYKILDEIDDKCVIKQISYYVNESSNMKEELIKTIMEEINPVSLENLYNLDMALCKSFRRTNMNLGYINTLLYNALDKTLLKHVNYQNSSVVMNNIRRMNPYFPKPNPNNFYCYKKSETLKKLLYGLGDFNVLINECIYEKESLVLFYENYKFEHKTVNNIKLESYIVPKDSKLEKYMLDIIKMKKYKSNEYIKLINSSYEDVISTTYLLNPIIVQGRSVIPVNLNEVFKARVGLKEEDFDTFIWNSGREWDEYTSGMCSNEGCKVIVTKKLLDDLKDKKLIYKLSDGNKIILLDYTDKEIIDMGEC